MFYILRHGRTDWNERHMLQGDVDIPLNETGRQMARDAAEEYKDIIPKIVYDALYAYKVDINNDKNYKVS